MDITLRIEAFAKKWLQKLDPWMNEPVPFHTTQRICLNISGNVINLLQVNRDTGGIEVLLNEDLEFDNAENLAVVLAGITKRYHLESIPAYWLLTPDEYQLFYIDALPVKSEEFKDALNWRLRSLINFPLQEATTDYFMLPAKKSGPNQPMVVAITARKQQLQKNIDLFQKAGMTLAAIDIPELALRNLAATCENDEKSTAFLYFYNNMAILNLTRQKILYFTRRITITNTLRAAPNFYESISLEILRYLDYFQSQWRHPIPSRFYIASQDGKTDDIIAGLNKHLVMKLEPFPLSNILINQNKAAQLNNHALLSVGAILRQEEPNVTTGN